MDDQNRIAVILISLKSKRVLIGVPLALLFIGVIYVALVRFGVIKDPFPLSGIPFLQTQPRVDIKTEYKNPFDKKTQYVNPFDTYKNPFEVAK